MSLHSISHRRLSDRIFRCQSVVATALLTLTLAGLTACSRDPMTTTLPLNLADIPKIQPQLNKLKPEDRDLVLGYLKRSKGDVLPAKFADPDEPFTARTFAEAIKLQRDFKAKQKVQDQRTESMQEARESKLEPMRKALGIELAKREIVTSDQAMGREARPGQALNNTPMLVTTWRLINASGDTITRASGSVTVRTTSDPSSLMGITSCYIDHTEPIPIGQIVEVRCGGRNRQAGEAEKDFVSMPESSLVISWEPKSITLAGGTVMRADN